MFYWRNFYYFLWQTVRCAMDDAIQSVEEKMAARNRTRQKKVPTWFSLKKKKCSCPYENMTDFFSQKENWILIARNCFQDRCMWEVQVNQLSKHFYWIIVKWTTCMQIWTLPYFSSHIARKYTLKRHFSWQHCSYTLKNVRLLLNSTGICKLISVYQLHLFFHWHPRLVYRGLWTSSSL